MKTIVGGFFFLLAAFMGCERAAAPPSPPPRATASAPTTPVAPAPEDFPSARRRFETATKPIEEKRAAALFAARSEYVAALERLLKQALAENQTALATGFRAERDRVVLGKEITDETTTTAPHEVLALRRPHLLTVRRIEAEYEETAAAAVAQYGRDLEAVAAALNKRGEGEAALLVRIERDRIAPRAATNSLDFALMAWLPLTKDLEDHSENRLRVQPHGTVTLSNSAAYFTGDKSWLILPHLPFDERPFAVSLWLKLDVSSGNHGILEQTAADKSRRRLHLLLRDESRPYLGFYMADLVGTTPISNVSGWTHLVFQYTGLRQEIWSNGQLDAAQTQRPYLGDGGDTLIGRAPSWSNVPCKPWKGWMRDVRIYHRCLTSDQIQTLAATTKGQP